MKKLMFIIFLILFSANYIQAEYILDSNAKDFLEEKIKKAEDSGYADVEFDILHKKITDLLPKLSDFIIDDKKENAKKIIIPIAFGETFKSPEERYLFNGELHLYISGGNKISKLKIVYTRVNPIGDIYLSEKREIVNPTPSFYNDDKLDSNDDITLVYHEKDANTDDYVKLDEITLKEIPFFEKKMSIMTSYKKYLYKAYRAFIYKLNLIELNKKTKIRHLLDLN
ncbi:MAG: hypothetical protein OEZ13_01180 [Spirochaetia bacterium]|nr:hypothetical protein [Spirochaetia bacterium]